VLSFFLVALGVAYPLGSLVQGPIIDRIGIGLTTAGTALALLLILTAVALLRPGIGRAITNGTDNDGSGPLVPLAGSPDREDSSMSGAALAAGRTVTRVTTKQRLGPDAQVDDKAIVIAPTDPSLTDPFLALSEDWFSEPGFEWHPHRGLETITTVLDGVLEHGDNIGNAGALHSGDVQWMTAGRGIIHRELAFRNEHAHTLQLWLNLPARSKMVDTRYQDLLAASRPALTSPGVVIDVISGLRPALPGLPSTTGQSRERSSAWTRARRQSMASRPAIGPSPTCCPARSASPAGCCEPGRLPGRTR